ncbi:MAG: GTP cyclohydrolase I [Rickettsiales bacterium]|nr:GTP cyclohydrolase I [Rickettsiales bacterium]
MINKQTMNVNDKQAETAVTTLLKWLGDNPNREGLKETPKRVLNRYKKLFKGYQTDIQLILKQPTIPCKKEMGIVIVPDIKFISFCEHHLLPMIGKVHIAYLPSQTLAGIGSLVKIVNAFTHRLQLQENLTTQIADTINEYLKPKGVATIIQAEHYCTDPNETKNIATTLLTHYFLGVFQKNIELQNQLLCAINKKSS